MPGLIPESETEEKRTDRTSRRARANYSYSRRGPSRVTVSLSQPVVAAL